MENQDMSNLDKLAAQLKNQYQIPQNEYEHLSGLLRSSRPDDEVMGNFSKIVDEPIQLTYIGSDTLLSIYQRQSRILISLFDMARRDPRLKTLFLRKYYGWRNMLLLTRAKNGKLMNSQMSIYNQNKVVDNSQGYGSELYQAYAEEIEKNNPGMFTKFMDKLKRKGR